MGNRFVAALSIASSDDAIVLLDPDSYPNQPYRNLLRVSPAGMVVWRAELPDVRENSDYLCEVSARIVWSRIGSMFFIPRVNVIESDEGFAVEVLGRTGIRYQEGIRTMNVESEVLTGPEGMMVVSSSINRWNPPHDKEPVDDATRVVIVERIRSAFRFRGIEVVVA